MNNLLKSLIIFVSLFSFSAIYAQEMKISGTVFDSSGVVPVKNAMAMAVRIKDSVLLGFARTDENGYFKLNGINLDTFSLVIDHPSFDDKTYFIFGHKENDVIDISNARMFSKSQEIEEVVIYANKNPIFYRGDTLVYVADSFKVWEGAVVEDLLKKLPGLTVDKEGKITSQGQDIDKVLVDGDEFFGTDPTIATKNLGADGIETVQVYETENEEAIGGDDEKIKVLDLRLKKSAKKGYFGRISGASDFALTPINGVTGTSPFFEGEMLLNKFDGPKKISVFALGSNTPTSNFGGGDMRKFGLNNEDGSGRRFWEDGTTNTSGIPQTFKSGIYFSDKIGKNKQMKFNANYSYYNTQLEAISSSRSEYFLRDTTYFTDDSTRNFSRDESHRFNIKFVTPLDSLTTLEIKPAFRYDLGKQDNTEINQFIGLNGVERLRTKIDNSTDSEGYSLDGSVKLKRKFKKKKRELELRYNVSLSDNATDEKLDSRTTIESVLNDSITDQQKTNDNSSISHYGTMVYIEPLLKALRLEFEYLYENGFSEQDKEAYDELNGSYTGYRADLSNIFDNARQQHRAGLRLLLGTKKHNLSFGARVRNIDILNVNKISGNEIHQNFTNLLPRFRYEFSPSKVSNITLNYRTSSSQPSINALAPVIDNTNPNRIQEGNPDLVPNYTHSLTLGFGSFKAMKGQYFGGRANINFVDNAFGNSTEYDQFGRTISKTVNVNGNINSGLYAWGSFPFFSRKLNLRPGLNSSFNRNVSIIEGAENKTDNISLGGNINFQLEFDSLEIGIRNQWSYSNPTSSLSSVSNSPFSTQEYEIGFKWRLPKGFVIASEGTYTKNTQEGEGFYNLEYFVWNAEVSKSFLKTNNLVVALVGKDLLNQNINASRQVNGNIITDYRTTIISRYFLLKVTLRFNNRKAEENGFNGMY